MNRKDDFIIEPYSPAVASQWDAFVDASRNATFLLNRAYMDYHSDRFTDASLMIYNKRRQLVALFAACEGDDRTVSAHGGLTYGGLILPYTAVDGADIVNILRGIIDYFRERGVERMVYKAIPYIYHRYPSDDDLYAIFRAGGRLIESNLSSTIPLSDPISFNENARRNCKRALSAGIRVEQSSDFASFWHVLTRLLAERFNATPVHTLDEMLLLANRFPKRIKLYAAINKAGDIVAGTVLYVTDTCVHAQYIAASDEGKSSGALALVFDKVIKDYADTHSYLDLGTSNEDHGRSLNEGLIRQKYGFGGRGVTYNIYELIF